METYDLATLRMNQEDESWTILFDNAKLMVMDEYGTRSWFIDVNGIPDSQLLDRFANTADIDVTVEAVTIGGRSLKGSGFFHPNPKHQTAAVRGHGELVGYAPGAAR
ncbi:hypothetical protein [Cohnella fermenti]|uniref:Uncharacterized protein n=1 Tax=Cohnella fermenti TaxID=2565925 RepID=A0A4S4BFQ9_9BACL|nr:hypothetical protein [Cohnella fermenti]THF73192.1 hypothetical protein E6C55_30405 [Cohnella fermenti]